MTPPETSINKFSTALAETGFGSVFKDPEPNPGGLTALRANKGHVGDVDRSLYLNYPVLGSDVRKTALVLLNQVHP
jgi:hypothetical protein